MGHFISFLLWDRVGKGKETLALPYFGNAQRITFHPYSAPLHKIKTDDMLPLQLLTPFQVRPNLSEMYTALPTLAWPP